MQITTASLLLALLVLVSEPRSADALSFGVQAQAGNNHNMETETYGSSTPWNGETSASVDTGNVTDHVGNLARAVSSVDAEAGTLRVAASAGAGSFGFTGAVALAVLNEDLIFSWLDADPTKVITAQLWNHGWGTTGGTTPDTHVSFDGVADLRLGDSTIRDSTIPGQLRQIGTSPGGYLDHLELTTTVLRGEPVQFTTSLRISTFASDNHFGTQNMLNTSSIYFVLPEGVSYTSQSGAFLTNSTFVPLRSTSVPEPSTVLLLASGLAFLFFARRFSSMPQSVNDCIKYTAFANPKA